MNEEKIKKQEKEDAIKDRVVSLYTSINERLTEQRSSNKIDGITYYKELQISENNGIGVSSAYVVRIANEQEKVLYEIYYEIYNDDMLVATMDEGGMIKFSEEYRKMLLEAENGELFLKGIEDIEKQNIKFKEPEELSEEDKEYSPGEIEGIKEERKKQEEDKAISQESKEPVEENLENEEEKELAEELDVPMHNIMIIRKNSQLLKDYPELKEEGTFFYRGNDGKMHAEYRDEEGKRQPSKYIETSRTVMRPASVNLGRDGENIQKDVPYQVMQTKGLTKGRIQDVRFEVRAQIGKPLELGIAQRGVGQREYTASDVSIKGKEPPTYDVKEATRSDMKGGTEQATKINKAYNFVSKTGLGADGVELSELTPQETIQKFIDEGYNRDEAIDILNLTIGEQQLTEEQAKEVVNQKIKEQNQELNQEQEQEQEHNEHSDRGERLTPEEEAWQRKENGDN